MTAYVLTEAQMKAYWALERRAGRADVSARFDTELRSVDDANEAASDLPTEGAASIAAERLTHPGRGWTAEHDRGHAGELVRAAVAYAFAADSVIDTGHQAYTFLVPAPWPWAEHYWKPSPDAARNIEKAGGLLAAAIDEVRR